jgi:predicted O-methyltransferase YrrM
VTTLNTPPVRPILDQLFADAERTMAQFRATREELRAKGLTRESPEFRAATRQAHMAIAPETGELLYLLARARKAQTVVEFGASFGVSTIHLAAALRDNGGGLLVTTEIEPTKAAATKATLAQGGLADLVELREGDARQTLALDRPRPIDLLFLDGANHLYLDVLAIVEPDLVPAALIVADNADTPGYRDHVRSQDRFVSIAVGSRVEVTLLAR